MHGFYKFKKKNDVFDTKYLIGLSTFTKKTLNAGKLN